MSTLKQQLYREVANRSLNKLRSDFIKKSTPKKNNRFSIKKITYEISSAGTDKEGILFELSSKIPFEKLPIKSSKDRYFRLVKEILMKDKKKPESIEMDKIVTNPNVLELKERDYVKVEYKYTDKELFNDHDIVAEIKNLEKTKTTLKHVPGVNSVYGRLVLLAVEDSIFKKSFENMTLLIKSNEDVLKQYAKKKK